MSLALPVLEPIIWIMWRNVRDSFTHVLLSYVTNVIIWAYFIVRLSPSLRRRISWERWHNLRFEASSPALHSGSLLSLYMICILSSPFQVTSASSVTYQSWCLSDFHLQFGVDPICIRSPNLLSHSSCCTTSFYSSSSLFLIRSLSYFNQCFFVHIPVY